MATSGNTIGNLEKIIDKIGHPIEEIRIRALESIIFKLDHGVLQASELASKGRLFTHLLEWFNFPDVSKEEDVLRLILRLAQLSTVCKRLVDLGGVQFLSSLRKESDESRHALIDSIMERLFLLPNFNANDDDPLNDPVLMFAKDNDDISGANIRLHRSRSKESFRCSNGGSGTNHMATDANPCHSDVSKKSDSTRVTESLPEHSGFRIVSLGWIEISSRDFHILESTNKSIESKDCRLAGNACNVLNDVILRDFLPEIFLQHSEILQNLIRLMCCSSPVESQLAFKAVRCLSTFVQLLTAKVGSCCDASMYNFKRRLKESQTALTAAATGSGSSGGSHSNDSRPSVLGQTDSRPRGDGQDGDAPVDGVGGGTSDRTGIRGTTSGASVCMSRARHAQEIGIPQFCMAVLTNCSLLLECFNPKLLVVTSELIKLTCNLLGKCIRPLEIHRDPGSLAKSFVEKLFQAYAVLSSAVLFHYIRFAGEAGVPEHSPSVAAVVHRLAYITVAGLLVDLSRVGVDAPLQAGPSLDTICSRALSLLSLDFSLRETHPDLHKSIVFYSQLFPSSSGGATKLYANASVISDAAAAMIQFQKNGDKISIAARLHMARSAVPCLHHLDCNGFIGNLFNLLTKAELSGEEDRLSRDVLLNLLACGEDSVRELVYAKLLDVVKEALSVDRAAGLNPGSGVQLGFVLSSNILKQIVVYGLGDSNAKVTSNAKETLLLLLKSKLIISSTAWGNFLDALSAVFPRLQAHTDLSTPLGLAVFQLVDTDNSHWTKNDLFLCNLRFLYLKDVRLKTRVIPRIAWFLGSEEQALYRLPPLSRIDVSSLVGAFVETDVTGSCGVSPSNSHRQHFEELMEVFLSEDRNPRMRILAGQQMVYLFDDDSLFGTFRERNGTSRLVRLLQSALTTTAPGLAIQEHPMVDIVPICLEMIRHVATKSYGEMVQVSDAGSLCYLLVRAVLMFPSEGCLKSNAAIILAQLLFDDCQPKLCHPNYVLPFSDQQPITKSRHHTDLPSIQTDDPLLQAQVASFLALSQVASRQEGPNRKWLFDRERASTTLNNKDGCLVQITHQMVDPMTSFQEIGRAMAHKPALASLKILYLRCCVAVTASLGRGHLQPTRAIDATSLDAAFARFLSMTPKSNADKNLLKNVASFLNFVLNWYRPLPDDILRWMYDVVCKKDGALCSLLQLPVDITSPQDQQPNQRDGSSPLSPLTKEVITLITSLLSSTPYDIRSPNSEKVQQCLTLVVSFIMRHMNLVEAPQFYNLVSLEIFLRCLVHVTARASPSDELIFVKANDALTLVPLDEAATCKKLTTLLMEVVVSFHLERDSLDHSFMGRGVTVAATLCLGHLAARMQGAVLGEDWMRAWFYTHASGETSNQLGLGWLIPLWTHTDLEVRAASLSIVVSLTQTQASYRIVADQMQEVAGGLWGVALSFLLDHSEASIVRERAALLLVNLTAHLLSTNALNNHEERWRGAIILGSDGQTQLVGQAALLALLHRSNFMHEMATTLRHFSLQDTFRPVVIPASRPDLNSAVPWSWTTMTSMDFETQDPPVTPNANSDDTTLGSFSENNLNGSQSQEEPVSLTTPALVSSICLLLKNLVLVVAEESLHLVRREKILGILVDVFERSERYLKDNEDLGKNLSLGNYSEVIAMLTNVVDLFSGLCQADPHVSKDALNTQRIYRALIRLLTMDTLNCCEELKSDVDKLQVSVYTFLVVSVLGVKDECNFINFLPALGEHFPKLLANLSFTLGPNSPNAKKYVVLVWVSHIFAKHLLLTLSANEADKFKAAMFSKTLDGNDAPMNNKTEKPGSILMMDLLALFNVIPHNIQTAGEFEFMEAINGALTNLIAVSDAATDTAVSSGLVTSVITRMNLIHAHGNLPYNVDIGKTIGPSSKNKISFVDVDLICQMNLLKNMMHHNNKAKLQAMNEGLVTTVSGFWSTVILDRHKLLPSILSMLCNYVAHCAPAAKSLTLASVPAPLASSNRSLLHEIQELCQQEIMRGPKAANFPILDLGVTILASSSFVSACRGILSKSKLIGGYTNDVIKKLYRGAHRELFSNLWLKLLINLTFKAEGQEIVLTLPEIVEVLLELYHTGQPSEQEGALLVLRNLCFLPTRKSKLLHSVNLLTALSAIALKGSNRCQTLAASALWALLCNSQKGKTTIKSDHLVHNIQDSLDSLKSKGQELNSSEQRTFEILQTVFALLKEN